MWRRIELKSRAKAVLRSNYWTAFWVSIVIMIAQGSIYSSRVNSGTDSSTEYSIYDVYTALAFIVLGMLLFIISLAFRIFVGYHLEVGGRRYFTESARYADNRWSFRFAFDRRHYFGILVTMLLKGVQNFLWFLLFIIPGIVKMYAYSMVPYLLAENPNIGARRAIRISNQMTYGHKFDMFVLDLSFIPWYIPVIVLELIWTEAGQPIAYSMPFLFSLISMIIGFVGIMFILPYYNATRAELYLVLRQYALERGMCDIRELSWYQYYDDFGR